MTTRSVAKEERKRTAKELALREAIERYEHEMMGDEERLLVLERIKRLKKVLGS